MSTTILQQYNIEIRKDALGRCDITSPLEGYIYIYRDKDNIQDFIDDIDLAINGNFDQIEDPDYDAGITEDLSWFATITPTHFEVWFNTQNESQKTIIPLEDWKEILLSWKECLEGQ